MKFGFSLALEEMRSAYQQFIQAGEALDHKASALLGAAGLLLGLVGVLQISSVSVSNIVKWGLALAAALYLVMVWLCIRTLFPHGYTTPIKADWDVLSDYLLTRGKRDAVLNILSGYVAQIQHNQRVNEIKARNVRWAAWIFAMIIVLLLLLSVLG
ncbi:MAG: hypothetical protein HPY59_17965 [Anaerolineae bacterium]|nr:hypothetical protein [Anaerolineae bacterium]